MIECTISVTNTSTKEMQITPGKWFTVKVEKGNGYFMNCGSNDKLTVLKPGESVSQLMRLFVYGGEEEVELQWRFVPK